MSAITNSILLRRRHRQEEAASRAAFLAEAKGEPGPAGPIPDHQWVGTKLKFQKPDLTWGAAVDLIGPKGDEGKNAGTVVIARGGTSGTDLADLLPGAQNIEPAGIPVLQNGQWVNLPWAAFISTIAGAVDVGVELARRTDFVGDSIMYRGEATPGTTETTAAWRIKRIEFAVDGDVTETWAGGNADFSNAWAARETLGYS